MLNKNNNKSNDLIKLDLWYKIGLSIASKFGHFSMVDFTRSLRQASKILKYHLYNYSKNEYFNDYLENHLSKCCNDLICNINNILQVVKLLASSFAPPNQKKFKSHINALDKFIQEIESCSKFCDRIYQFDANRSLKEAQKLLNTVAHICDNLATKDTFDDFIDTLLETSETCAMSHYDNKYNEFFKKEKELLFEQVWLSILEIKSKDILDLDGKGILFTCKVKELLNLRKDLLNEYYISLKSQEDIKIRVNLCLLHRKVAKSQQDAGHEIISVRGQQANIKKKLIVYGWGLGFLGSVAYFFKLNKSKFVAEFFVFTDCYLGVKHYTPSEREALSIVNPCLLTISQAFIGEKFWKVLGYGVTNHAASLATLSFEDLLYKQVNLGVCRAMLRNKAAINWFLGLLISVGTTAIIDELSVENLFFIFCNYIMGASLTALKDLIKKPLQNLIKESSQKTLQNRKLIASKEPSSARNQSNVVIKFGKQVGKMAVGSFPVLCLSLLNRLISNKIVSLGSLFLVGLGYQSHATFISNASKNDVVSRRNIETSLEDFVITEQGKINYRDIKHNENQTEIKPKKEPKFSDDFYYQNNIKFDDLDHTKAFYMSAYGTYRLHRESDRGKDQTISDPIYSKSFSTSCDRFATMNGTLNDLIKNIGQRHGITSCLLDVKLYRVPVRGSKKYYRYLVILQPKAILEEGVIRLSSPTVLGHLQHKDHDLNHPGIVGTVFDRTAVNDPTKNKQWSGRYPTRPPGLPYDIPEHWAHFLVDTEYLIFLSTKFGNIGGMILGYVGPDPFVNPMADSSEEKVRRSDSMCGYFEPFITSLSTRIARMWQSRSPLKPKRQSYVLDNTDGRKFGFQTDMLDLDTRLETVINAPTKDGGGFSKYNTVPVTWELNARMHEKNGTMGDWSTLISSDQMIKGERKVFKTYDGSKVIFEHGSIYEATITSKGKKIVDSKIKKLPLGDDITDVAMFKEKNKIFLMFIKANDPRLFLYDYYAPHNPPIENPLPISKQNCTVHPGFDINMIYSDPFDLTSEKDIVAVYKCKGKSGMWVQRIRQNKDPRGSTFLKTNMTLSKTVPIKVIKGVYKPNLNRHLPTKISTTTLVQAYGNSGKRVQFFEVNYGNFDGVFSLVWPPIFINPHEPNTMLIFLVASLSVCCVCISIGGGFMVVNYLIDKDDCGQQSRSRRRYNFSLEELLDAECPEISLKTVKLMHKYLPKQNVKFRQSESESGEDFDEAEETVSEFDSEQSETENETESGSETGRSVTETTTESGSESERPETEIETESESERSVTEAVTESGSETEQSETENETDKTEKIVSTLFKIKRKGGDLKNEKTLWSKFSSNCSVM